MGVASTVDGWSIDSQIVGGAKGAMYSGWGTMYAELGPEPGEMGVAQTSHLKGEPGTQTHVEVPTPNRERQTMAQFHIGNHQLKDP